MTQTTPTKLTVSGLSAESGGGLYITPRLRRWIALMAFGKPLGSSRTKRLRKKRRAWERRIEEQMDAAPSSVVVVYETTDTLAGW